MPTSCSQPSDKTSWEHSQRINNWLSQPLFAIDDPEIVEANMADIELDRQHTLGVIGATKRLQGVEDKLRDKYGVTLSWREHVADVHGKGVSGLIVVEDNRVSLKLKLGMLLKPLKSKIREGIERQVDNALT